MSWSKVFITGATGFVGSHLARALAGSGAEVRVLKRPTSDDSDLRGITCVSVTGSLEDKESLKRAVAGCDLVFHCAGLASFWSKHREALYEVNVLGTRNLLAACMETGVGCVVVTSSTAALGIPPPSTVGDEETAWNWHPYNIGYMETKFLQLEEVDRFTNRGLRVITVMPGLIVGDGDRTGCASRTGNLMKALRERQLPGYAPGGITVISVADVVRGHILAAEWGRPAEKYIIGGADFSFREIFDVLADAVGVQRLTTSLTEDALLRLGTLYELKNLTRRQEPLFTRELAHIMSQTCYYSSAKAGRELGYVPSDPRPVIGVACDWYLANGYAT